MRKRSAAGGGRCGPQARRDVGIAGKAVENCLRVGVEIEHRADAGDEAIEHIEPIDLDAREQCAALGQVRDRETAARAVQAEAAAVGRVGDGLDAGHGASAQEAEHALPVIGRTIGQREDERRAVVGAAALLAQLSRAAHGRAPPTSRH